MKKEENKISIDQIIAFTKIPQCKSLKNVAKVLSLAPSSVSASIAKLENAVGEQLILRHQNGLELTAEGTRFYEKANEVLCRYNELKDNFVNKSDHYGDLRISTWHGVASFVLCHPVIDFIKEKTDQVNIDIVSENLDKRFEDYNCDIAIRPFFKNRSDLVQEKIFTMKFYAFASTEYTKKYGIPQSFDELDNHRLLSSSYLNAEDIKFADWHLFEGKQKGAMRKPFLSLNSSIGLATCCDEGLGIATFPVYYTRYLKNDLVKIFPDFDPPNFDFYIIYPKVSENSKKIQIMKEFLKDKLADQA